jgi:hypothetical protein
VPMCMMRANSGLRWAPVRPGGGRGCCAAAYWLPQQSCLCTELCVNVCCCCVLRHCHAQAVTKAITPTASTGVLFPWGTGTAQPAGSSAVSSRSSSSRRIAGGSRGAPAHAGHGAYGMLQARTT